MPIAEIPLRLAFQYDTAQATATSQHAQLAGAVQRKWWTPDDNGWDGDPLTLTGAEGIGVAFDRAVPNDQYVKACRPDAGGRLGDRMVSKLAVDTLACMERAYRAEYASSVRCRIHSAARRRGHGSVDSPYTAFLAHLADLLSASYSAPRTPDDLPA